MTASIVQALKQWYDSNRDSLRDAGIALKVVGTIEDKGGRACVSLESAHTLCLVTVWNHMSMCDVDQLSLPSRELLVHHHENLSVVQLANLMDGLAAQARKG